MKTSYRPATADDLELTYRIKSNSLKPYIEEVWGWNEDFQQEFHKKNFNPKNIQIILLNNTPLGYLESEDKENTLFIYNLLIDKSFQNKGIGTGILTILIDDAFAQKKTVQLEVLKVNTRAKQLYQRLGFKLIGENKTKFILAL